MTLSEELTWRGFVNQTTLEDIKKLDSEKFIFYWGVDPSSDSMTVGNLAMAMMVKYFIKHGHKAVLLVGGATGMIGDPDGKAEERHLLSKDNLETNKLAITNQYKYIFRDLPIEIVDNYDWFRDFRYLEFLREVGKHVPMRQMLSREFVQSRLGEEGSGISYAEFSYVLIQAYDFLYLHQNHGVNLQVCGSDQWGNSIAGVDLIRRITGDVTHVWSGPLIVNPQTGIKFGKSEGGAIWLDATKTSPSAFYQFWVNSEDETAEQYLKIYTELNKDQINNIMTEHNSNPKLRLAQFALADEVTRLVHGEIAFEKARTITRYLNGSQSIGEASNQELNYLREEIKSTTTSINGSVIQSLIESGLAESNTVAKKLLNGGAVYINSRRISRDSFNSDDFINGKLLLRRGKAFKDTALVELVN